MKHPGSNFFTIDDAGNVLELPECDCCGAPIYRAGLCSVCASVAESVEVITQVSERVVINPEDLIE